MNEKEQAAADYFFSRMNSNSTINDARIAAEAYALLMNGYEHRMKAERVLHTMVK